MELTHKAFHKVDRYDIQIGDYIEIVWKDHTPNGSINFNNGRTGDNITIPTEEFHRIFRKLKSDEL